MEQHCRPSKRRHLWLLVSSAHQQCPLLLTLSPDHSCLDVNSETFLLYIDGCRRLWMRGWVHLTARHLQGLELFRRDLHLRRNSLRIKWRPPGHENGQFFAPVPTHLLILRNFVRIQSTDCEFYVLTLWMSCVPQINLTELSPAP